MSAIQTDVQQQESGKPEEEGGDKKPRQLTPREEAMERLSANRNEDFEKETGIKIESAPVTDPDADPDEAAAEAERKRLAAEAEGNGTDDLAAAQLAGQLAAAALASPAADLKAKVKIKLPDGEREMTVEDMQREVQKGLTADRRLEQAAEARRDLEAREAQLAAQLEAAKTPAKVGADAEVAIDPAITTEFTEALFAGDSAKATSAFNRAVSSATKAAVEQAGRGNATHTPVDPAAIAAQVRQQIAIDSVLEQSHKDYPQMYADPDIEAVAAIKIERLQKEGKPFAEALVTVSGEMATKFGWKAPTAGRSTTANAHNRTREAKLERKAEIDEPVGGPNLKSGTSEEPVQTYSDVINDMRKARGQLV